jgi:ubiquinone/menaquinone biosynthesis C-methylase UbiE
MTDAVKFWNKIAAKYAKTPIKDLDAYHYTLERTQSYLTQKDRVLELGCGTGSTALLLAGGVAEITATDLSDKMIEVGRTKATQQGIANVKFAASDIYDPGFTQGPYDAVMAFNLLHLLEDTEDALARIANLVKPGGYFISKTVTKPQGAPLRLRLMLMLLPLAQRLGKAPFVKFMSISELEGHITQAGFQIIETGNHPATPPPSRYIVARKSA